MKEKIVFFGAGPYVAPIIETLKKNFDLALVVTTESESSDPVLSLCSKNDIKTISISKFNSHIIEQIRDGGARIAVLASFGLIIPGEVLNKFELEIINIHPSLLPRYRGATPGQTAILAGDKTTGVSIIKLDEEVDHGPILKQVEHPIEPNDTSETLYRRLFKLGADLLSEVLSKYITGELKPTEQDHSKATFTKPLTRQDGYIDLSSKKLEIGNWKLEIARKIRAYYPWPGVWFKAKLNGNEKIIKLLPEQRIQVEGKNVMKLSDFANGYPEGQMILSGLSLF